MERNSCFMNENLTHPDWFLPLQKEFLCSGDKKLSTGDFFQPEDILKTLIL